MARLMAQAQGSGHRRHNRGEVCPDCGFVHQKCLGHAKHTNEERRAAAVEKWGTNGPWPCESQPRKGQEVCGRHGGSTTQAETKATERLKEQRARGEGGRMLDEIDEPAPPDPLAALDDLLDRAWRNTYVLGVLVGELDIGTDWGWAQIRGAQGAVQRVVSIQSDLGLVGPDHHGDQRTNVLWTMYGAELDRYARLVKIAIDTGLEERRVSVQERQAQAVLGAVLAGLRDAGVDSPEVRTAIAGHLRALEAGPTGQVA